MTLSDDLKDAERRAREAVEHWSKRYGYGALAGWTAALDRYAAVCRLAGRWEQYSDDFADTETDWFAGAIAAELARLMADCP